MTSWRARVIAPSSRPHYVPQLAKRLVMEWARIKLVQKGIIQSLLCLRVVVVAWLEPEGVAPTLLRGKYPALV